MVTGPSMIMAVLCVIAVTVMDCWAAIQRRHGDGRS
jgi:hypothetical protein